MTTSEGIKNMGQTSFDKKYIYVCISNFCLQAYKNDI